MVGAAESRRKMMVIAHHKKPLDDGFLIDAFERLRSPQLTRVVIAERLQEAQRTTQLRGGLTIPFPHPAPTYDADTAALGVVLRQSDGFQLSNARQAALAPLLRERDQWVRISTPFKSLSHTNQLEVDWFIEKACHFLPAFEPDLACGDNDVALAKYCGEDPAEMVWPLAYYGPTRAVQLGRERLLSAPAWEVKEDEHGGIWIQAAQNPFTTRPADLKQLAAHLGVKARK